MAPDESSRSSNSFSYRRGGVHRPERIVALLNPLGAVVKPFHARMRANPNGGHGDTEHADVHDHGHTHGGATTHCHGNDDGGGEGAAATAQSPELNVTDTDPSATLPLYPRYLPGCSGPQPKEKQTISNSMMQAYIKMRGPATEGSDDPLFEWIRLREDLPSRTEPTGNKKDVSEMLQTMDKYLEETNMGGDSPRDAVFEVERPPIQHIEPPENMDFNLHSLSASCAEFDFEQDDDDDEGNEPSGRISPCTFLAWSRNCTRWDDTEKKVAPETLAAGGRHRPPTPEVPATPRDHLPWYYWCVENQCDEDSGRSLSPHYQVPSSPSIIYSPPGVTALNLLDGNFGEQYRRMAPLAIKSIERSAVALPEVEAAGVDEHYTHSEVEEIADEMAWYNPNGTPSFVRGRDMKGVVDAQWHIIKETANVEKRLYAENEAQSKRLHTLERERARLIHWLPILDFLRIETEKIEAIKAQREREQALKGTLERKARIQAHISTHALERAATHGTVASKHHAQWEKKKALGDGIARLELDIGEICLKAGKLEPKQVFEELRECSAVIDGWGDDDDDGGGGGGGLRGDIEGLDQGRHHALKMDMKKVMKDIDTICEEFGYQLDFKTTPGDKDAEDEEQKDEGKKATTTTAKGKEIDKGKGKMIDKEKEIDNGKEIDKGTGCQGPTKVGYWKELKEGQMPGWSLWGPPPSDL